MEIIELTNEEILKSFQNECEEYNSDRFFVDNFRHSFINRCDYFLIKWKDDQNQMEENFKSIDEPWHFICTKENQQSVWLKQLLAKLKIQLGK